MNWSNPPSDPGLDPAFLEPWSAVDVVPRAFVLTMTGVTGTCVGTPVSFLTSFSGGTTPTNYIWRVGAGCTGMIVQNGTNSQYQLFPMTPGQYTYSVYACNGSNPLECDCASGTITAYEMPQTVFATVLPAGTTGTVIGITGYAGSVAWYLGRGCTGTVQSTDPNYFAIFSGPGVYGYSTAFCENVCCGCNPLTITVGSRPTVTIAPAAGPAFCLGGITGLCAITSQTTGDTGAVFDAILEMNYSNPGYARTFVPSQSGYLERLSLYVSVYDRDFGVFPPASPLNVQINLYDGYFSTFSGLFDRTYGTLLDSRIVGITGIGVWTLDYSAQNLYLNATSTYFMTFFEQGFNQPNVNGFTGLVQDELNFRSINDPMNYIGHYFAGVQPYPFIIWQKVNKRLLLFDIILDDRVTSYRWHPDTIIGPTGTACITVIPTATTDYSVLVTDALGGTGYAVRTVTVNQPPTIQITGPQEVATSTAFMLSGNTGLTGYAWYQGAGCTGVPLATTQVYSNLGISSAGAHTFSLAAQTLAPSPSCTSCAPYTVTVGATPTIAIIPANPSVCSGTSTSLCVASSTTGETGSTILELNHSYPCYARTLVPPVNGHLTSFSFHVTVYYRDFSVFPLASPLNVRVNIYDGYFSPLAGPWYSAYGTLLSSKVIGVTGVGLWTVNYPYDNIYLNTSGSYIVTFTQLGFNQPQINGFTGAIQDELNLGSTNHPVDYLGYLCSGGAWLEIHKRVYFDSLTIDSGAATYVWSPALETTSGTTGACLTVAPTTTRTYHVLGTSVIGTTGYDSTTVTVLASPVFTISGSNTVTRNTSFILTATAGLTGYTWYANACNGTVLGTGETLVVNGYASIGTYTFALKACHPTSGCCACATASVTVLNDEMSLCLTPLRLPLAASSNQYPVPPVFKRGCRPCRPAQPAYYL